MTTRFGVLVLVAAIFACALPHASTPSQLLQPPAGSTFVVASVKLTKEARPRVVTVFQPGGRFVATANLQRLIAYAYEIPPFRMAHMIVGEEPWVRTDFFDVEAKAVLPDWRGGRPTHEMLSMVQSLLEDRFKLVAHYETRDLPIYELILARSDGRLGSHLRETDPECLAWMALRGTRGAPPQNDPTCGENYLASFGFRSSGTTMSSLANFLTMDVDRIVEDRTDLSGEFDIDLQWGPTPGVSGNLSDTSIFTAVQEQLGLKLQAQKGPFKVLVVDRVERPSAD